jgi:holo-[acyl-carrier protein] synthase
VIVGIGVDLVGIERIARLVERQGRRFLDRVYTAAEQAYCLDATTSAALQAERLAARWAAKEACMKALGTGWAKGVGFLHIALLPGSSRGAPRLELTDQAKAEADRLGADRWHCSVSHERGTAVAMVILERA